MYTLKQKLNNFIDKAIHNRNQLFFSFCLCIHVVYFVVFCLLTAEVLSLINFLGACFYAYLLFIRMDTSDQVMKNAFFEILIFSMLSTLTLGSHSGFFLFAIGVSSIIFFLIPSAGNKRFLYQALGMFVAFMSEFLVMVFGVQITEVWEKIAPFETVFFMANLLLISMFDILITFLYSRRRDTMDEFLTYNMYHDQLTGLYNRRYFERHMEQTGDTSQTNFVICMLDIDFFKKVNDTYGHAVGDIVLVRITEIIKEFMDQNNLAVRWGGEEFILYYPNATLESVHPIMEELRKRIEDTVIEVSSNRIQVTVSIGVGMGLAGRNYIKVIDIADDKLYQGKQKGRNCVIV